MCAVSTVETVIAPQKEPEAGCGVEVKTRVLENGMHGIHSDFEMGCESATAIGKCWFTL
jgi:hypothetical protein